MVDGAFDKLLSYDITRKVFMARGEEFKEPVPESVDDVTPKSPQIMYRKQSLEQYLLRIASGDFGDSSFVNYLQRMGRNHTDHAEKKSGIHEEYVHISALFGWMHAFLVGNSHLLSGD